MWIICINVHLVHGLSMHVGAFLLWFAPHFHLPVGKSYSAQYCLTNASHKKFAVRDYYDVEDLLPDTVLKTALFSSGVLVVKNYWSSIVRNKKKLLQEL